MEKILKTKNLGNPNKKITSQQISARTTVASKLPSFLEFTAKGQKTCKINHRQYWTTSQQ